jgi:hypothetical protein
MIQQPIVADDDEGLADVHSYLRWLLSDAPERVWQRASFAMWNGDRKPLRWLAKHLKVDPTEERAWFALAGFAPLLLGETWHIAAATPAPDPFDPDSSPGDTVVIVDPASGKASVVGDPGPALVSPSPQPESLFVHTDGLRWLREWADARVIFLETRRQAIAQRRIVPRFCGEPPSAVAIGPINKLPWAGLYARRVRVDAEHAKTVKSAIFRAANLPRVEAA